MKYASKELDRYFSQFYIDVVRAKYIQYIPQQYIYIYPLQRAQSKSKRKLTQCLGRKEIFGFKFACVWGVPK